MYVIATGMTCRDIGGIYVDEEKNWYIERITKLIKQCDDIEVLKIIHRIVENLIG